MWSGFRSLPPLLVLFIHSNIDAADLTSVVRSLRLPKGFKVSIFADNVPGARSLSLSPTGTLFVGTRAEGKVYALPDKNKDHVADEVIVLATGLNMPNGVALKDGDLYVAEVNKILKFPGVESNLKATKKPLVINDSFPKDKHHGWKFIRIGPDGLLYVPVGAPCNVCESKNEIYSSIVRMKTDGTKQEIFAKGVRNTVGFDWHPETQELWFTDNGRDMLGDNTPPDELNRAERLGQHFGFPYCHGRSIVDPEFGSKQKCQEFIEPAYELGAHVAALGMRFYTGKMFPAQYRNKVFIAEHGSWNRSSPVGYKISLVDPKMKGSAAYTTFVEGWLPPNATGTEKVEGRPVDLEIDAEGAMLVSDDKRGVIYRITYAE
jgi:glucose/arabinose dehydrogenase